MEIRMNERASLRTSLEWLLDELNPEGNHFDDALSQLEESIAFYREKTQ